MDRVSSNQKTAAGAPKDGHQMLNEFQLVKISKLGDIDMSAPQRQEVEMGNSFSLEV
jgi:hypothetical protein